MVIKGKETLEKIGHAMTNAAGHAFPKFDPRAGAVLVTGSDGVVSYRVAARLLAAGYPAVRIGCTDPSRFANFAAAGGDVVEFDWDKTETFEPALKGMQSVFIALPHHANSQEAFLTFCNEAKKAGVQHYVKLSFYHALAAEHSAMTNFVTPHPTNDPFLKVPLVQMHRACDSHLIKMPHTDYTLLFASHFMSNPTVYQGETIRKEHKFYGASQGKKVGYVSPNDVAEVAVRSLLAPKEHSRVGYTLTGPVVMEDQKVAEILSARMSTTVTYQDEPLDAQNAMDTDWGPALDVAYLEYVKASGVEDGDSFVTKDVEKVCGHPAESYEDYLNEQDLMTPQELVFLMPYP